MKKIICFGEVSRLDLRIGKKITKLSMFEHEGDHRFMRDISAVLYNDKSGQDFFNEFPESEDSKLFSIVFTKNDKDYYNKLRQKVLDLASSTGYKNVEKLAARFDELPDNFGFMIVQE